MTLSSSLSDLDSQREKVFGMEHCMLRFRLLDQERFTKNLRFLLYRKEEITYTYKYDRESASANVNFYSYSTTEWPKCILYLPRVELLFVWKCGMRMRSHERISKWRNTFYILGLRNYFLYWVLRTKFWPYSQESREFSSGIWKGCWITE